MTRTGLAMTAALLLIGTAAQAQQADMSFFVTSVGSGKGANWKVVGEMVIAWVITIPSTAIIGFLMFKLTQLPTVAAWIAVGIVVGLFAIWAIWQMMHTIHAKDVAAAALAGRTVDPRDRACDEKRGCGVRRRGRVTYIAPDRAPVLDLERPDK